MTDPRFAADPQPGDGHRFEVGRLVDFSPEPTTYLIDGLLPDRELVVLVGEEGIGKGLYSVWLVAQVTARGHNVLIIATEDDLTRTIRPRMDIAGVDSARVFVMYQNIEDRTGHPTLPHDLDELARVIREHQIRLVVIDPWVTSVSGGLKLRDTQQARTAVDALTALARSTGCTALAIAHPNRGEGSLRDRVGLTAVLRQAARMLCYALEAPGEPTKIYVGVEKANGWERGPADVFRKVGLEHDDRRIGRAWMLEPLTDEPLLRIEEWDQIFAEQRDHRRSDRWLEVLGQARRDINGRISRTDIIAIYEKADSSNPENAASKAISRWLKAGKLIQIMGGIYEVKL